MKNSIPPIGTEIRFHPEDTTASRDGRTAFCRIKFDESLQSWVIVPQEVPRGLMVFLNEIPDTTHKFLRITKIQPTGKGVYADPVQE